MHRMLSSTLSAFLIFALITLPAKAAPAARPLGVVVVAQHAKVGEGAAVNGATVFQGDRLLTAETGQLQVRFGGTQARLLPGSLAVIGETAEGVNANLLSGSLRLSSAAGERFSLSANQAVVRAAAAQDVLAQVTRVSPGELLLVSGKGALEIAFDGEVTTLAAGSSYRMLLEEAGPEAQGPAGTRPAGRTKRRAVFILLGAAGAAAGIAVAMGSSSSTSAPVSPSVP